MMKVRSILTLPPLLELWMMIRMSKIKSVMAGPVDPVRFPTYHNFLWRFFVLSHQWSGT